MPQDPIVEDIRKSRQKIFEACEGDLEQLMDRLKAAETADRDRLVSSADLRKRPLRSGSKYPLRGEPICYEKPTEPVAVDDWQVL